MTTIHETTDYDKFEMLPFNRNVGGTKGLKASMRKYGFLSPYPIHVVRNGGGKLKIKDGHHRFYVARELNIPVKYVISTDDANLVDLIYGGKAWSNKDFLDGYCRCEWPDYIALRNYCDESGIQLRAAMSMLAGESALSGNIVDAFRAGRFKIKKGCDHAQIVKNLVMYCKKCGIDYATHSNFVGALSKIAWVKEVSITQFMVKIKKFTFIFVRKATVEQYLELFDEIYNRKQQVKIPVKFLAESESAKRKKALCGL